MNLIEFLRLYFRFVARQDKDGKRVGPVGALKLARFTLGWP